MLDLIPEPTLVALVGLVGGVLLGLAARIGRFCTLGAIEDLFYGENTLRLRMWGIGKMVKSAKSRHKNNVIDICISTGQKKNPEFF